MAARKWLVRSLIVVFATLAVFAAVWLNNWVKPSFVRQQLIDTLQAEFIGVDVEVKSARLRILGGILVDGLKLYRTEDQKRIPFLTVPTAILYHDKEQLGKGRLVIRKVEMEHPVLVLERDEEGKWVTANLFRESKPDDPAAPTFLANDATIRLVDRRRGVYPIAEIHDASLVLMTDPATTHRFELTGLSQAIGSFHLKGSWDRLEELMTGSLDLPEVVLSENLIGVVEAFKPDIAAQMRGAKGDITAHLDWRYQGGMMPVLHHDLAFQVRHGEFEHPSLPGPITDGSVRGRIRNGSIVIESSSAFINRSRIQLALDLPADHLFALTRPDQAAVVDELTLEELEKHLRSLSVRVDDLTIDEELLRRLPPKLRKIDAMCRPRGPIHLQVDLERDREETTKQIAIETVGIQASYEDFPYPLREVTGKLVARMKSGYPDDVRFDFAAKAGGKPVQLKGTVQGERPNMTVKVDITGQGLILDEPMIAALPAPYPEFVRKLHATTRADVTVTIRHNERVRREFGPTAFDNEFQIDVKDGTLQFDEFPYPLRDIRGLLVVRSVPSQPTQLPPTPGIAASLPDPSDNTGLVEFRDFVARHAGAILHVSGQKETRPGSSALTFDIRGENVPIDDDLRLSLATMKLDSVLKTFSPRGSMNCVIQARLLERDGIPFRPDEDLDVKMSFAGLEMLPEFFPYTLRGASGQIGYRGGRVEVRQFTAKHDDSTIRLPRTEVILTKDQGFYADVRDIEIDPIRFDDDLLRAFPKPMRDGMAALKFDGRMKLLFRQLVVRQLESESPPPRGTVSPEVRLVSQNVALDLPPPPPVLTITGPLKILPILYWDGTIELLDASFQTGGTWEHVRGRVSTYGRFEGEKLGHVRGNIAIDSALFVKQPVEHVVAHFVVDPREPNRLRFPAIQAKLFGGDIGGQAQVDFENQTRFDLKLNATRVQLEQFARRQELGPKSQLQGLATAQIFLTNRDEGRPTAIPILQGSGKLDIDDGRLMNLPFTLDLLKVLGGRVPDHTAFEEAHILFGIRGRRLRFGQLDLIGNALSLGGEGEMNLDGTDIHLEFYTVWSNLLKKIASDPIEALTAKLSKSLFKIEVSGRLDGKMEYKKELVPGLVEPIQRLLGQDEKHRSQPRLGR